MISVHRIFFGKQHIAQNCSNDQLMMLQTLHISVSYAVNAVPITCNHPKIGTINPEFPLATPLP